MTETGNPAATIGDDLHARGLQTMTAIVSAAFPGGGEMKLRDGKLADEINEIGVVGVWGALWSREGLSPRDRSLVTLGILIALGAEDELASHVRIGLANGLTRDELAEVIYHASGYAGFPRAMTARKVARAALGE
ncbi:carboxymuconolactone decarboxylase family protein [Nocardia carnea]|uniref:carboxymuconolactone decarboxylase family protein n=1 Tax=Nocardia carnea TaxID=37328 RepID=UPI003D7712A2